RGSGELKVVEFGVTGAAGEERRALGQPDRVVARVQVHGRRNRAEPAPAGGRRVAHRRPGAAVVGQALGGRRAGAVRVAEGHRVGAATRDVHHEVDVAVAARVTTVVDAADVTAVGRT